MSDAPEIVVCCGHCHGDGVICETVHVYETGCGFSHPDVASKTCPECHGMPFAIIQHPGDKIVTDYWRKPGPTDQFDWGAVFADDEPNDNGSMLQGYGATESAAIEDLLRLSQEQYECLEARE